MLLPAAEQPIWQWAEEEIVFRKPYDAIAEGPYDSSLTPFWREPMEKFRDRNIREIWLIKPPQGGASENILLMPMRWAVRHSPQTVLYVSGDIKSTTEFMEERIKPGLQLSPELRERYAQARAGQYHIYFDDMMIVVGWAGGGGVAKQRPVEIVLGDEVAIWPGFTADQLRRRQGTKAFPKIVGVSSLSPKDKRPRKKQPIYIEFMHTDRRYYFLPDPHSANRKTRKWFPLVMGMRDRKSGKESPFGLKWDPRAKRTDGTWDKEVVVNTAYYRTPWGQVIDDHTKGELIQRGRWKPTNAGADPTKWGGHLNRLYLPWQPWGDIARSFVEACEKKRQEGDKTPLKVFIVEDLGEDFWDEREALEDDIVKEREGEYAKGTCFTTSDGISNEKGDTFKKFYIKRETMILTTADVMKGYGCYLSREWVKNGDSGLIDWGEWHTWGQLNQRANDVKANHVLCDAGYGERTQETYEACAKYKFVPTMGKENIAELLFAETSINPFEGTKKQKKGQDKKKRIKLLLFKTDPFKTQLVQRIAGKTAFAWYVYHNIDLEYGAQVTAEEKIDGVWSEKSKDNHAFDMEVLQLLGATRWGFNRFRGFYTEPEPDDQDPDE